MYIKKQNVLMVFIILGTLLGRSIQENSKLIFEISEVINDLNKPNIDRRHIEIPVPQNFLTPTTYLRDANDPIVDRICKKTGCSCGRSGFKCDAQDVFDVASDVKEIIDETIDTLDQDNLVRCGYGCKQNKKQKKHDSFTDDFNINSVEQDTGKINLLEAVLTELNKISKAENKVKLATKVALTPEDIYEHYRSAMDEFRETLLGFVKYRTGLSIVRGLPREIRNGIQSIRDRYRHFKISDKSLKKDIFQVLLDDMLKIKIVPNKDPEVTYDVFMPNWMHMEVLKKKNKNLLRAGKQSMKRILPLTSQQKIRLQKKQGQKKLLKFAWRRSLGSDIRKYGVPFVLDIQGLAQVN